jgi:hypothetical protein
MKPTTMDDLSTAIERAAKNLRGGAAPTRKRMSLDEFVTYTLTQIAKAADDPPDVAKRRLAAVKRSVDDVIGGIAKMAAEDTDSERVDVEVVTAFAPTGDPTIDGITTGPDQASTEVSVTGIAAATGDTNFAENLKEVAKALAKMKADLEAPAKPKPRGPAKKAEGDRGAGGDRLDAHGSDAGDDRGGTGAGEDGDGWPLDLNNDAFLQGDRGAETTLTWGTDPDGVASPKAR